MTETRYLAVTGGCSNCPMARHPSLIGHRKKWSTTEFPYCVILVNKTKQYDKAKITCKEGEFTKNCPLKK